ncbi:protein FAR1-RELATED SEQUENCE 3-like [Helianthus annuus]|uniref:protein FAR1-RELATED SEQUENCE 3-like n=1 Tax=Helianthus annuus TaxID=4232 RepID=UPI000B9050B4|nr:protein FAR1-RELATED SEQUENCE 3-like [Helianthus annuus]
MLQVMIREEDVTVKCICNRFEQFGLLCSHIFCVLRILDVREFPKQYILRRWTREALPNSSPGSILTDGGDPDRNEEVNRCIREIRHGTEYVVNKLISKFDQLCNFRDHIKQFMLVADEAQINAPPKTRRTSRNAKGNAATIGEGDAATVVEGDGPGSNDVDDVFYTSGNDADLDDEDMAE